mgnify:CR=1 FL=1
MAINIKDLELIKEQTLANFGSRIGNDDDRVYIMTCCGTGCTSSGSYKKEQNADRGYPDFFDL